MRFILYIIVCFIFILSCTGNITNTDAKNDTTLQSTSKRDYFEYPKIVDSLNVRNLYDSTKWYVYLQHCQDTPKYVEVGRYISTKPVPFSSLELRFDTLEITGDSLGFIFQFYIEDTLFINPDSIYMEPNFYFGLLFYPEIMGSMYTCSVTKNRRIKYQCIGAPNRQIYDTTTNRDLQPLQPDVVKYINDNKKLLHPWFYREAVKRGVLKD